ncbi:GNAT family N-acetyltransferase [Nocardia sp. CA-107356]|uniref:GNAT family N-acetyltransferase n=1 Tax=Nocardia sp. CA-107356 TaxID=3239972 RepID=UPI003D8A2707
MISVRRLGDSDWQIYRDLQLASLTEAPDAAWLTYDEAERRSEADWRDNLAGRAQFAALLDDIPVGTAGGWVQESPECPELISMWVAPQARGKGAGDVLVRAVLEWASSAGCRAVGLWVLDGNEPAERLYRRHGFRRTGRRQVMPRDASLVEVEMVVALDAAAASSA